jgi:hypothetical protein
VFLHVRAQLWTQVRLHVSLPDHLASVLGRVLAVLVDSQAPAILQAPVAAGAFMVRAMLTVVSPVAVLYVLESRARHEFCQRRAVEATA